MAYDIQDMLPCFFKFECDVVVVEDGKNVAKGRNRQVLGDIGNVVRGNYPKNKLGKVNHRPRTRCKLCCFEGDVVVVEDGKNVAKGRNRQVLGDIGNVVRGNYPKNKLGKVNHRPRTRSQNPNPSLLVDENLKKPVVKRVAIPKPKKAAGKSKVVEVIEISSDSDEEHSLVVVREKKATKKKSTTYTSVLTARSKAACGIEKKQKEVIVDIDSADAKNDLAAVEYVEEIYRYYKSVESEWRPRDYMHSQPEINENMRLILVEWLIDVHVRFELNPETFYLTVHILDRFLSVKPVPRKELQLVGLSALLMSSKYEEIWPPHVGDLADIADHAYSHKQILVMEKTILSTLEWYLTVPTHYVFLARFIKASIKASSKLPLCSDSNVCFCFDPLTEIVTYSIQNFVSLKTITKDHSTQQE
ncbi:PREDICTED: cyclin-B1-1-like [Camelina sativa]|uniref:Cyclin-B1-1-like n=1 Tax=Camelina sativa TaxID=90675 RepID=A0ABM1REC7_CAMSA|nr:PREDICTED: cyclin-B1-1-like [Camelina sativa]